MMSSNDFNKIEALQSHKRILEQKLDHTHQMIKTINETLAHLRGKNKMKHEELYYDFDSEKQKEHQKYLVDNNTVTQDFLDECNKKVKDWSDKEKNAFIHDMEKIIKLLIIEIEKGHFLLTRRFNF